MEKIKLTFLGTSGALPTKQRNLSGILVNFGPESILVDCGEGIQRQLKLANISPAKITRILITHWHGDHFFGLPGLFQTLAISEYNKTLKIYGPRGTKKFISLIEKLVGKFRIKTSVEEISGKFIDEKGFYIESKQMTHGIPSYAYSIVLKDKIRLNKTKLKKLNLTEGVLLKKLAEGKTITYKGKKISAKSVSYMDKGKKLTIVMDTALNNNAIKLAKSSDLLVAESTFLKKDKDKAKKFKHLTASDAATIAKKSRSKRLVITHISQRYTKNPNVMESEAKKIFKNTVLAKDFMKLEI